LRFSPIPIYYPGYFPWKSAWMSATKIQQPVYKVYEVSGRRGGSICFCFASRWTSGGSGARRPFSPANLVVSPDNSFCPLLGTLSCPSNMGTAFCLDSILLFLFLPEKTSLTTSWPTVN
jgi:hypothetical protein